MESGIEVRECRAEKEKACTIELCICVVCCCWSLQLSWSVGSGEETFAGIVAIAAGKAGLWAECREFLNLCRFHASTFCVNCLWRRGKFVGQCLALVECGAAGTFIADDCVKEGGVECSDEKCKANGRCKANGKIVDDYGLDFALLLLLEVCFIATRESFEAE